MGKQRDFLGLLFFFLGLLIFSGFPGLLIISRFVNFFSLFAFLENK